ncbi:trigger factor [Embleya hyalina]|uniref:Trigger factor n=1 Tax=Embleya hyalina TaxID=516124 RepID=A0A401Z2F2_9ACTN|nr:trigger factor [Embleya hyalina]GCE00958.1 trigger factor [Embleya hyalina]
MKSAVETLNPTRVRLTVEVPSEELKPSLDAAYKKIGKQVTVPGFRKGKIPARIIDQRFGREAVFVEAFDDILSSSYGKAVEENELRVLGQPEVTEVTDVTELAGGADLKFTAEVDTRPEIELPDYSGIEVEVDDITVTDEDVAEKIEELRDRFGALNTVERAAAEGDTVVIDIEAKVDGEVLEDGVAKAMSYQIGGDTMLDGLDAAVIGASAGETKTFETELQGGSAAGQTAEVSVVVTTVKAKELPELDDDFAQLASEFDTLDELKADLREKLDHQKLHDQQNEGRDKVLEALLEQIEVPLPESIVTEEIEQRRGQLEQQLGMMGMDLAKWLEIQGQTAEEYEEELQDSVRKGMRAQFVLDEVVKKEQLSVNQEELTQHLIQRAQQSGMSPDQFAQQVMQSGYVPVLVGEVARGKALEVIAKGAKAKDASGNEVGLGVDLHADDHEGHDHAETEEAAATDEAGTDEAAADKTEA